MTVKEKFIQVYNEHIKREGADKLLEYLLSASSDFFTAPASARYHSSYEGGLCEHSLNVFDCLVGYLESPHVREDLNLSYSMESIAIVSLLHDLCKINVYKKGFRNVKDESGAWKRVDTFEYDDPMPYGHGEKSVYMISPFMKLTREEALQSDITWDILQQKIPEMFQLLLKCFLWHLRFLLRIAKPPIS